MAEDKYLPPQELVANANITAFMKKHGIADLDALLKRAEDHDWYWGEVAKELEWYKPYTKVLDDSNAPFFKWFTGGSFNIVHNCLDRHMKTAVKDRVAFIYEPEPTDQKIERWTYAMLYHEVNKQVIDVATKILEGTGVISRDKAAAMTQENPPAEGDISTIEEYRALRIHRLSTVNGGGGHTLPGLVLNHDPDEGGVNADSEYGGAGRGTVLHEAQADPIGYLDGHVTELPGPGDGGSEDPAGSHPQDQGRG